MLRRNIFATIFFTILSILLIFSSLLMSPFGSLIKNNGDGQSLILILFNQRYIDILIVFVILFSVLVYLLFFINKIGKDKIPCSLGSLKKISKLEENEK
jgi:hypothetical protein